MRSSTVRCELLLLLVGLIVGEGRLLKQLAIDVFPTAILNPTQPRVRLRLKLPLSLSGRSRRRLLALENWRQDPDHVRVREKVLNQKFLVSVFEMLQRD